MQLDTLFYEDLGGGLGRGGGVQDGMMGIFRIRHKNNRYHCITVWLGYRPLNMSLSLSLYSDYQYTQYCLQRADMLNNKQ